MTTVPAFERSLLKATTTPQSSLEKLQSNDRFQSG